MLDPVRNFPEFIDPDIDQMFHICAFDIPRCVIGKQNIGQGNHKQME
jgi:hypothetical protein